MPGQRISHEISIGELVRLMNWTGKAEIERPMPLNVGARMILLPQARKDTN